LVDLQNPTRETTHSAYYSEPMRLSGIHIVEQVIAEFSPEHGEVRFKPNRLLVKQFGQCRLSIIESGLAVEHEMKNAIAEYFCISLAASQEFKSVILDSDWCTYSSKRKLIKHLVENGKLLTADEAIKYDKSPAVPQ
jgi:hypothetical protein